MAAPDHEFMRRTLEKWLAERLPEVEDVTVAPLRVPQGAGNSAETIFVDASYKQGGRRRSEGFVMRLQNEGSDLFLNASLELPWKIMQAMSAHPRVPVPDLVGIEHDRSLFGAPFFLMRLAEGRIVAQTPNYNLSGWVADLPADKRREVWSNGIRMMAEIHKTDWRDGFQFLNNPERGKPGLEQLVHWTQEWFDWTLKGRPHPVCEEAMRRLHADMPKNARTQVLWGDPGTHNMLFKDDLSVSAVIDWEIATLGPGEADLGWWLFFDDLFGEGAGRARLEGLPDREETIAIYEAAAGRKTEQMDYYSMLAELRMCLVVVRTFDRHVATGKIPPDLATITDNPLTRLLAKRLGMPLPEISQAFLNMTKTLQRD